MNNFSTINTKKYLAEFLGTFLLTFVVYITLVSDFKTVTPLIAGFTLGLIVYILGPISGAHVNPAITFGALVTKKIEAYEALFYIIFQFLGAFVAGILAKIFLHSSALLHDAPQIIGLNVFKIGVAEFIGATIFAFGVASVVFKKVSEANSGFVIGGSLAIGIIIASQVSNGVLNPAVSLGIGSFSIMYLVGPVIGAGAGFWLFKLISE